MQHDDEASRQAVFLAKFPELHTVETDETVLRSQPKIAGLILNQRPNVLILQSVGIAFEGVLLAEGG